MTVKISKVRLKSGHVIDVSNSLTLIVGPNNVGKTLLLTEIAGSFRRDYRYGHVWDPLVVEALDVLRIGSVDDLLTSLEANHEKRPPGHYEDGQYLDANYRSRSGGGGINESLVRELWANSTPGLGPLANFLMCHLLVENRTGLVHPSPALNLLVERPSTPMQLLYVDRLLEQQFSDLMQRAFGVELTINRYAGNTISAHIGRTAVAEPQPPPSLEYLSELSKLAPLHSQGDGIRAFMGILLMIKTGQFSIIMIDEPEAFLHPPQAYLLGRILAEEHAKGTQVIVSTHSSDILRGVTSVQANAGNVTIARLTRSGQENHVAQVPSDAVRSLYEDPLIKHYGVLDGLFFHGVVLCEADSDCTYYQAVLETIGVLESGVHTSSVSLHFAHTGGKARLPRAVQALRSAGVAVVSIVDFDILRDDKDFTDLVAAHGGSPDQLMAKRNDITSSITTRIQKVRRDAARSVIDSIFDSRKAEELTSGDIRKIQEAVSIKGGWRDAKRYGRGYLSGQAVTSFDFVNAELRRIGIFIVEVGELERFHPEVPADNKAEWLRVVLEGRKFASCEASARMMKDVCSSILDRQ